jgi:NADH dehydrogenase FAD-containing subunit
LPTSADGALLVDRYLRSVADPRVFGGGDCIAFQGRALPRVGVYAIREAPILFHNLLATLQGRPLRPFKPQRHCLLILNLGDGTGLATWGRFHWHGRLAFWLKDRIDRAFLREYQECVK